MTECWHCTRCGERLRQSRIKWLELSTKTGRYSDPEVKLLPADESQGAFPFGQACAKTQIYANDEDGDLMR